MGEPSILMGVLLFLSGICFGISLECLFRAIQSHRRRREIYGQ